MKALFATKTLIATLAAITSLTALGSVAQADRWHYLIDQRLSEHQRLIDEGRAEGLLTWREAAQLKSEQTTIRRIVSRFRADGRLSTAERDEIRELQDDASQQIFVYRSNGDYGRPRYSWWK